MPDWLRIPVAAPLVLLLAACNGGEATGPVDVRWDRDACERCRMVLSDRFFAAEVRVFPQGKSPRVFKFDDIGCAVLWLEKGLWNDDPKTEIWVKDHRNGDWIAARTAVYIEGWSTPMEYGLGAQADNAPGALSFEEARQRIHAVEKRFGIHGVQLREVPMEPAGKVRDVQDDWGGGNHSDHK